MITKLDPDPGAVATLDNGLGLFDPQQCSPRSPPQVRKVVLLTSATVECLRSLDQLLDANCEALAPPGGKKEKPPGKLDDADFPSPDPDQPSQVDAARLPLRETWEQWYAERPKKLLDKDGLELLRARVWCPLEGQAWKGVVARFGKAWGDYFKLAASRLTPGRLKQPRLVGKLLDWLLRLHPPAGAVDFLLDAVETSFALVPHAALEREGRHPRDRDWRLDSPVLCWLDAAYAWQRDLPDAWGDRQRARLWQLLHWRDQPAPGAARLRPDLGSLAAAFRAGVANAADVYDQLLGPRGDANFRDLSYLTAPTPPQGPHDNPALKEVVDRCRERILDVELARGEKPTAATEPARSLGSVYGTDVLLRLLRALGKQPFASGTFGEGRAEVLTKLVRVSHPRPGETAGQFAAKVKAAGVPQRRLLELVFLAPQWLEFVEQALGWPGLQDGVWWFYAHTPGGRPGFEATDDEEDFQLPYNEPAESTTNQDNADPWEEVIAEQTSLTARERADGAVDAAWFQRAFAALGKQRWEALAEAARVDCDEPAYQQVRLLSDVLQGRVKKAQLVEDVRRRKRAESVRLLGLLPPAGGDKRESDVQERYQVLQDYLRHARGLPSAARQEALRAYAIGLENLAHTAGYSNPQRLEWAMETRAIADLAVAPVSATSKGMTVTLSLDERAHPHLTVRRGDKELTAVPPALRKDARVAALAERHAELGQKAERVRRSLEEGMVHGHTFRGAELCRLFAHPLLAPVLERLVLLGEGIRGYPVAGGRGLADHLGRVEPVKPQETLRIAHPHDLLIGGDWERWQAECFHRERVQPFKQVFRELYVPAEAERREGPVSHRYAGQQVSAGRAPALLSDRGWTIDEEGSRTFVEAGLTARLTFRRHGETSAKAEPLILDGVYFRRRGGGKPLGLGEVPTRIFSEVMRDIDLAVSAAHPGAPEASPATVAMRAALARETCSMLRIDNFRIQGGTQVLITGKLGRYTVHLGTGVVQRQAGGAQRPVAIDTRHLGRPFLPFAEDDPRTAEVLWKVILLARDNEIQDPAILRQLR